MIVCGTVINVVRGDIEKHILFTMSAMASSTPVSLNGLRGFSLSKSPQKFSWKFSIRHSVRALATLAQSQGVQPPFTTHARVVCVKSMLRSAIADRYVEFHSTNQGVRDATYECCAKCIGHHADVIYVCYRCNRYVTNKGNYLLHM